MDVFSEAAAPLSLFPNAPLSKSRVKVGDLVEAEFGDTVRDYYIAEIISMAGYWVKLKWLPTAVLSDSEMSRSRIPTEDLSRRHLLLDDEEAVFPRGYAGIVAENPISIQAAELNDRDFVASNLIEQRFHDINVLHSSSESCQHLKIGNLVEFQHPVSTRILLGKVESFLGFRVTLELANGQQITLHHAKLKPYGHAYLEKVEMFFCNQDAEQPRHAEQIYRIYAPGWILHECWKPSSTFSKRSELIKTPIEPAADKYEVGMHLEFVDPGNRGRFSTGVIVEIPKSLDEGRPSYMYVKDLSSDAIFLFSTVSVYVQAVGFCQEYGIELEGDADEGRSIPPKQECSTGFQIGHILEAPRFVERSISLGALQKAKVVRIASSLILIEFDNDDVEWWWTEDPDLMPLGFSYFQTSKKTGGLSRRMGELIEEENTLSSIFQSFAANLTHGI